MQYIQTVCEKINFPAEATDFFIRANQKVMENQKIEAAMLQKEVMPAFDSEADAAERAAMAKQVGLHPYSLDMLLLLRSTKHLQARYRAKGYTDALFYDTVSDLRCKMQACKAIYGVWGTFVFNWFRGAWEMNIFKLGRLQFERAVCTQAYKNICKAGDFILNIHIPEDGALTPQSVDESLQRAAEFFDIHGTLYAFCHSWMLYPPHYPLFPENSNLQKFYNRFEIFEQSEKPGNGDTWRIFDTMETDYQKLPQNSRLQKNFYRFLNEGHTMGLGFGILSYPMKEKNK